MIWAIVAVFALEAVMPPVRASVPPVVTVGVVLPPWLVKASPASVLSPTSVSVPPPFTVTTLAGSITPPASCVSEPLSTVMPPAGR